MPTSLTTFASGATIDATILRTRVASIETYLNEEIASADRSTNWLDSNRIYRPDFFGYPDAHTRLVTGESHYRQVSTDESERRVFSYYLLSASYIPVPGLCATFHIPSASTAYFLRIFASFYVYDFGGDDTAGSPLDETTYAAANVRLAVNGTTYAQTHRTVYKGSQTGTSFFAGAFYPRKQYSMAYTVPFSGLSAGINTAGVYVAPLTPPAATEWKHLFFQQGNLVVRYYIR